PYVFAFEKQGGHLVGRHQAAEIIALHRVALVGAQKTQLTLSLHTLGNRLHVEGAGHRDDGPGERRVIDAIDYAADERLIDLDGIERKALEVAQTGITRAEIVQ